MTTPQSEPVRILVVEDLPTDAELTEREIRKALKHCVFKRVDTQPDYLAALDQFRLISSSRTTTCRASAV